MTLKTHAGSTEIKSLPEFVDRVKRYDWTHAYSDSHNVYMAGKRQHEMITAFAEKNPEAKVVWEQACELMSLKRSVHEIVPALVGLLACDAGDLQEKIKSAKSLVFGYLSQAWSDKYTIGAIRSSVADHLGKSNPDFPRLYAYKQRDQREKMIDAEIERLKEESK